ncbi:MAG: lamin tail domain-containing protein [Candidatus Omnitrophica bacterium]|nr:lamin tail domain-containing protein [Candidatus Omnitrophota bacterium]
MKGKVLGLLTAVLMCWQVNAGAFIVINEILADPASGLAGDADGNGTRSVNGDEFIELVNNGNMPVDITGWFLTDASSARHIFVSGSVIDPFGFAVVFGSSASTGSLSLNNSGDVVSLYDKDNQLIDQVLYDSALGNQDQSFVRWAEGEGNFILHTTAALDNTLFSPGTTVDEQLTLRSLKDDDVSSTTVVPEPSTSALLLLGCGSVFFKRRFK